MRLGLQSEGVWVLNDVGKGVQEGGQVGAVNDAVIGRDVHLYNNIDMSSYCLFDSQ